MPPQKQWAAPKDWEAMRPHITRLYVEEGRQLKQVMDIMATQYSHYGTRRMYTTRITSWGLAKNKREEDMTFILHETQRREEMGKRSSFAVRGRVITLDEVLEYFSRRGGIPNTEPSTARPSTPEHISYSTPPPQSPEVSGFKDLDSRRSISGTLTETKRTVSTGTWNRSGFSPFPTQEIFNGWALSCIPAAEVPRIFSTSPQIPSRPSTPKLYYVSEQLLLNIGTYFDSSFSSGKWITNQDGECINAALGVSKVDGVLGSFIDFCHSGTRLIKAESYKEARIMLSGACKLVKSILEAEDPRSLDCVLEAMLYLKQEKMDRVLNIIRSYISTMATVIFAQKEHPWKNIWRLIGSIEDDQLESAIDQSWRRASDAFERNLGRFHVASLVCYLEYIRYGSFTAADEEASLRQLLVNCETMPNNFTPLSNILYSLEMNLARQNRHAESELLSRRLMELAQAEGSYSEQVWGWGGMAVAQVEQGMEEEAETTLRQLIAFMVREQGPADPLTIEWNVKLERWLRGWGKEAKADILRAELDEMIKHHEDEEGESIF